MHCSSSSTLRAGIPGVQIGLILRALITESPHIEFPSNFANSVESVKIVCNVTRFPMSYVSTLSSSLNLSKPNNPEAIFKLSLKVSIIELSKLSSFFNTLASTLNGSALVDCKGHIDEALSRLNDSLLATEVGGKAFMDSKINDIQAWISATMMNQESCLDGLEEMESNAINEVKNKMKNCREYTNNSYKGRRPARR